MNKKTDVLEKTLKYFNFDELASKVWIDKYALKDTDGNLLETTPDDMHKRLSKEFSRIESNYVNPISESDIYNLFKDFKYIIPQGSPMFGIGNNHKLTSLSNCFVVSDETDSYGSIMKIDEEQIQLMKRRGGVGHDLSHIRPKGAKVNNAALTSTGVVPFMERYSNTTREVAQDGRRGALMLSILVNHPDSESFIDAKLAQGKVTGANISVKITDEFMKAVEEDRDFLQTFPCDIEPLEDYEEVLSELKYNELTEAFDKYNGKMYLKKIKARTLWNKIIYNAWKSAEPGILFWDKIISESPADCYGKQWKTVSTNPCLTGDSMITTSKGNLPISYIFDNLLESIFFITFPELLTKFIEFEIISAPLFEPKDITSSI
jgi:ribonucleoside-diphosphate reductase alpha chain